MIRCEITQNILDYGPTVSFRVSEDIWRRAVRDYEKRWGIAHRLGSVPDVNFIKGVLEILLAASYMDGAGPEATVCKVNIEVIEPRPTEAKLLTAAGEA